MEAVDRRGSFGDTDNGGGGGTGVVDSVSFKVILCSVHSNTSLPVLSSFTKFSGSK